MLQEKFFPDIEIVSLSGNFCTDKKPCAVNWCVVFADRLRQQQQLIKLSLTLQQLGLSSVVGSGGVDEYG